MTPHQIGLSGYPRDPELYRLQQHLGHLVGTYHAVQNDPTMQAHIVEEYHQTMRQLYACGWDDILDPEAELPAHMMPKEYGLDGSEVTVWDNAAEAHTRHLHAAQSALVEVSWWQRLCTWFHGR